MAKRAEVPDHERLGTRSKPCYIDLNATPARQAREIASIFAPSSTLSSSNDGEVFFQFLDGGIIGAPPSQDPQTKRWKRSSLVISGTVDFPPSFTKLSEALNMKIVSPNIGSASTLKLSFAALTKGLTALSILSFSTAERESVLPELLEHLEEYSPHTAALCTSGVTGMPPKAYRWVEEMRGIGEASDTEGSWRGLGERVYGAFAELYHTVAGETVLGEERVGKRSRGKTVEDVAQIMARNRDSKKE